LNKSSTLGKINGPETDCENLGFETDRKQSGVDFVDLRPRLTGKSKSLSF